MKYDPIVFTEQWFIEKQKALLQFANTRVGRDILGINKYSIGYDNKIAEIMPNYVAVADGDVLIGDFHAKNKYANNLRNRLMPLWKSAHYFDMFVANPFMPQFNLGFDTLNFSPQERDIAANVTVDGHVTDTTNNQTWAQIRGAGGTGANDTGNELYCPWIISDTTTDRWGLLTRGIALFNTAAIGLQSAIISAVLKMIGERNTNTFAISDWSVNIYSANPASNNNLVPGDYTTLGTTAYCDAAITHSGMVVSSVNSWNFNATGKAAIVKNGITKLGIREATYDASGVAPAWESDKYLRMFYYSADSPNDPVLTVTFKRPGGGIGLTQNLYVV